LPAAGEAAQRVKSVKEFAMRQQAYQESNAAFAKDAQVAAAPSVAPEVDTGALTPLWIGDTLLLARRVRVGSAVYLQGCWLAWPELRRELLESIKDLLPAAALGRAAAAGADDERRLAALPVRLVPGAVPASEPGPAGNSPIRLSLLGAWVSVVMAALSVAALLHGVMSLSERRRVFVSAVTHELRTPLTTFRLYT